MQTVLCWCMRFIHVTTVAPYVGSEGRKRLTLQILTGEFQVFITRTCIHVFILIEELLSLWKLCKQIYSLMLLQNENSRNGSVLCMKNAIAMRTYWVNHIVIKSLYISNTRPPHPFQKKRKKTNTQNQKKKKEEEVYNS